VTLPAVTRPSETIQRRLQRPVDPLTFTRQLNFAMRADKEQDPQLREGKRVYWALKSSLDGLNQEILDIKNQELSGSLTV
jgi:hypothetical protein